MNWMGGSLGRSRNAKTSLTAVQKKHFAKARAQLHSKQTFSSFEPSDDDISVPSQPSHTSYRRNRSYRCSDDVKETQQTASIFTSIKRQPQSPSHSPALGGAQHRNSKLANSRANSDANISSAVSSPSSTSDRGSQRPAPTPPAIPAKHAESIEAYRSRLLSKHDWAGLERTKPAKIGHRARHERSRSGKRRRLSQNPEYERVQLFKPQIRKTSYFERLARRPRASIDQFSQADVSVRIGSAVDRSHHDRGSRRGPPTEGSLHAGSEMLEDEQAALEDDRFPNPFLLHRERHTEGPSDQAELNKGGEYGSGPPPFPQRENQAHGPVTKSQTARQDIGHSPDEASAFKRVEEALGGDGSGRDQVGQSEIQYVKNASSSPAFERPSIRRRDEQRMVGEGHIAYPEQLSDPFENDLASHIDQRYIGQAIGTLSRRPFLSRLENLSAVSTNSQESVANLNDKHLPHGDPPVSILPVSQDAVKEAESTQREEETFWRKYMDIEGHGVEREANSQPSASTAIATQRTQEDVYEGRPLPYDEAPLSKKPTVKDIPQPDPKPDTVTDEEAIWRSFVFGTDGITDEWTFEEPATSPHPNIASPLSSQPSRTQASMIAEIDTSPVKQNPHLLSDTITGLPEISAAVSTGAVAGDDDDEEELDKLRIEFSSDAAIQAHSSSRSASIPLQLSGSTPLQQRSNDTRRDVRSHGKRWSVQAQPSSISPGSPDLASGKEVFAFSSPSIGWETAMQALQRHRSARRQAAIMFKKPTPYVGSSSFAVEPVMLGKAVVDNGQGKHHGKRQSKDEMVSLGKRALGILEGDEIEDD